jgi:chromosome partitioning protein
MYKIGILNSKGGVGKSTIAINLAYSFTIDNYRTFVADADLQGSARDWSAKNEGNILTVLGFDRKTLAKDFHSIQSAYDFAIIDSSSQLNEIVVEIINASNILIIPVTPSPYDVWATKDVLDLVKERQKFDDKLKAYLLINRYIANTKIVKNIDKDIAKILEGYDVKLFKSRVMQRQVYLSSINEGITVFHSQNPQAIEEMLNLKSEIVGYKDGLYY